MKPTKEEFKKLQLDWYERLKENGFEDIEKLVGDNMALKVFHSSKAIKAAEEIWKRKSDYFYKFSAAVNDKKTVFRNEVDKYICRRHAQGARIRDIGIELLELEAPRDRKTIRIIIRRYEMMWGMRCYQRSQLNLKKI